MHRLVPFSLPAPVLLASILLGGAACGDDDGGSDVFDAPAPDTTLVDSGPPPNYTFQNCGDDPPVDGGAADAPLPDAAEVADADPAAPDAAPAPDGGSTDGGTGPSWPGLNDPCCDPLGRCQDDLVCLVSRDDMTHQCRPRCDVGGSSDQCPEPSHCLMFSDGRGVCIPAGLEGDECAPEYCAEGLLCVVPPGALVDDASCHRCCAETSECEDGDTCTALPSAPADQTSSFRRGRRSCSVRPPSRPPHRSSRGTGGASG